MPIPDFDALNEDDTFLVNLGRGVWLMDDHRWALKVWETERKHSRYALIHMDYHWDCCYDFSDHPAEEERMVGASPDQIADLVAEGRWIQFDSFIAPAVKRGLIHTVHFYCLQDDLGDSALEEDFLRLCKAHQVIYKTPESLAAAQISGPIMFDLCLDLFNRNDRWAEGDLWTDSEIYELLEVVGPMVEAAELVTVSMSFNYSGTPSQTRYLTQRVVSQLLTRRRDA